MVTVPLMIDRTTGTSKYYEQDAFAVQYDRLC